MEGFFYGSCEIGLFCFVIFIVKFLEECVEIVGWKVREEILNFRRWFWLGVEILEYIFGSKLSLCEGVCVYRVVEIGDLNYGRFVEVKLVDCVGEMRVSVV